MNIRIRQLLILLLFTSVFVCKPERVCAAADSIRISLLTCTPGEEIYSLFGHTAIRYENVRTGEDLVFNYGIFSFHTPNFVWRFVKGETDYQLGVSHYKDFEAGYRYYNRGIIQQTLLLTSAEKEKLIQALIENYQPENRTYRYNFLYDNCATRPRDQIEAAIDGEVVYADTVSALSFRQIIHEYSREYPWDRFGMDFCLGAQADQKISYRQEMFAPFYLKEAFATAIVAKRDLQTPLVSETRTVLKEETAPPSPLFFTPLRTFLLLFILVASVTLYGLKRKRSLWGIDLLLFAAAGLAGCVVFFLSLFSEHPAVSHNYLILVFHPLHLIALPCVLRKERKGLRSRYHALNASVLTLFILLWWAIPQHFDLAVLPLALCLLVRSASNWVLTYKKSE